MKIDIDRKSFNFRALKFSREVCFIDKTGALIYSEVVAKLKPFKKS